METTRALKVSEVAEVLGMSTATVKTLLQRGEIPGKKIGGHWRTAEDELMRYLRDKDGR